MESYSKELVHFGDILSAFKTLHGSKSKVLTYDIKPVTSSVQGSLSLLLRVTAKVQDENGKILDTAIVIKRMPVMEEQLQFVSETDFLKRESEFFNIVVPAISKKLPVVECLGAYNNIIVMEDLCLEGYKNLTNMENFGNNLDLAHVRYLTRKLAEFHAASILDNRDWLKMIPLLKTEAFFESGRNIMRSTFKVGAEAIRKILEELYPNLHKNYSNWLLSDKSYEKASSFAQPSKKYLNVLNHGDFWENNIMFKYDMNNEIIGCKFIDFQLLRYAPASCDLLYILYLCTDKKFRDENEKDILHTYVATFNCVICDTPDKLTLDEFTKEWEEGKLFGALIAAMLKPMVIMENFLPADERENAEMVKEEGEEILFVVNPDKILSLYYNNTKFKKQMIHIVNELIVEMKKVEDYLFI